VIALLASLLVRVGLSAPIAKRAAPIVLAIVVIGAVVGGAKLWLSFHDAHVVAQHEAQLDARAAPARDNAAEQRAIDAKTIHEQEHSYHEAIANSVSDGPPDPAALALNCERLRRARIPLPAACGPGRGD
jgi:hypothetical protein